MSESLVRPSAVESALRALDHALLRSGVTEEERLLAHARAFARLAQSRQIKFPKAMSLVRDAWVAEEHARGSLTK